MCEITSFPFASAAWLFICQPLGPRMRNLRVTFSLFGLFIFKKGGMCNCESHTSVWQMHAFFRKDDRVDVVYHVLAPVPWLQAGVENVAVGPCPPPQAVRRRPWVSSTGFPLQTDSSLSREAPGLGPCIAGASGGGRVLKPSPWELRQPHWLPLAPWHPPLWVCGPVITREQVLQKSEMTCSLSPRVRGRAP